MWKLLDDVFNRFKICFSREAAFSWFVIIILGIMIRSDSLGVSSVIRDLSLEHKHYPSMMQFFRASSWKLDVLRNQWISIVKSIAPLWQQDDMCILIGDGVKQSKEARKMPSVKRLHQESENSSKAEYIFGHMFGGVGVLAGTLGKFFCIPLSLRLHDGVKVFRQWENPSEDIGSHVVEMIKDGFEAAKIMGNSLMLLDRYFLSVPALEMLNKLNTLNGHMLHILTKAKISCVAYNEVNEPKKKRKGRPRKKGDSIKLKELFETDNDKFIESELNMYGKREVVQYRCLDLLWGQKLYQKLRFVLVKFNGINSILVSTNLALEPEKIICLYSYRFKIECTFRELKQLVGGFSYQFWCKSMPKLKRYLKKDQPQPVEKITCKKTQKKILSTVDAIEAYMMCSSIAMGLLQIISLRFSKDMNVGVFRFLRTKSKEIVSEATVACYLRMRIFPFIEKDNRFSISGIIKKKQAEPFYHEDRLAS